MIIRESVPERDRTRRRERNSDRQRDSRRILREDDGPGIPESAYDKIFEAGYDGRERNRFGLKTLGVLVRSGTTRSGTSTLCPRAVPEAVCI